MIAKFYSYICCLLLLLCIEACDEYSISTLNIIEGKYVDESQYPTVVLLYDYDYDEKINLSVCSGVVVSENVVLTAAHCLIDLKEKDEALKTFQYKVKSRGVMIDDVLVGGSTPILLKESEESLVQDKFVFDLKTKLDDEYVVFNSISRADYDKRVLSLKKKYSSASHDIGALIFENRVGKKDPPFRPMIEEAKKHGKFFTLSKKVFEDGLVINEDEKSLFFLGYGLNSKYNDLNNPLSGQEGVTKLQIGNNIVKYSKNKNEWFTPKIFKNKEFKSLYDRANIDAGDSGGPLIYNNQILGVSSYGALYDCEGNDIYLDPLSDKFIGIDSNGRKLDVEECFNDKCCAKIVYAGSYFASFTFGSNLKNVEALFKKIKEELINKDLLETNSIFSEF